MSDEISNDSGESQESIDQELGADPTPEITPDMSKEEVKELWKEYTLRVNGKDIVERINLNDDAAVKKHLQLSKASNEAFQSKSQYEKQLKEYEQNVEALFKKLAENPEEILNNPDLGLSREQRKKLAEKILNDELDLQAKSPEQIKLEEAQAELTKLQEEKKQMLEAKQAAEFEKLKQEAAVQIEAEIMEAIDTGDLPKSNYITKKMADLAHIAFSHGIDINMKDLIPLVKKQYVDDMRDMLGKMPDEMVEELISRDRVKKMRNSYLNSIKKQQVQQVKIEDSGSKPAEKAPEKKMKFSEFFKDI
jgi:hypothetical protein